MKIHPKLEAWTIRHIEKDILKYKRKLEKNPNNKNAMKMLKAREKDLTDMMMSQEEIDAKADVLKEEAKVLWEEAKEHFRDAGRIAMGVKSNMRDINQQHRQNRTNILKDQSTQVVSQTCEADQIRKFKKLYDEGIITEQEFIQKRKKLLGL